MAPEKQIMPNFLPFSTKGEVFKTGYTQEVLERVVAERHHLLPFEPTCFQANLFLFVLFLIIGKKTSDLNVNAVSND